MDVANQLDHEKEILCHTTQTWQTYSCVPAFQIVLEPPPGHDVVGEGCGARAAVQQPRGGARVGVHHRDERADDGDHEPEGAAGAAGQQGGRQVVQLRPLLLVVRGEVVASSESDVEFSDLSS